MVRSCNVFIVKLVNLIAGSSKSRTTEINTQS